MEGIDRMDCPAGMGEAPWKVTGGSNDDGDWGHFRVWTIVEAEHVNGESREHKMVDSPGHWSSCSPYMQMQTSLCSNSRVLPADTHCHPKFPQVLHKKPVTRWCLLETTP